MTTRIALLCAALSLPAFVAACSNTPAAPDSSTSPLRSDVIASGGLLSSASLPATIQTTDVFKRIAGRPVVGSARLVRNDNGITCELGTTELIPGDVYTLWWVILQPAGSDPRIITNASGVVADQQGRAHFGGHISVGPVPPADGSVTLDDGVFDSPRTAEVRLVVHHHGPKVPGIVGQMLSTFDEGCAPCDDPQAAIFVP